MKKTLIILGILLAALMLVVACAPKEVEKSPVKEKTPEKEIVKEEVKKEEIKEDVPEPGIGTTADEDITAVSKEVTEIDEITGDLDMNDLEELDKELAELENLEI
ncbi:hypothetical protein KY338_00550 [Candidatus Woesearchaeota archaeon]|nr:hypothetical protein [Candidatus Woesearchaeota archaeon]MBW3005191.1 hypothetical protein [Candidatus Woesearchaeota archaeon]